MFMTLNSHGKAGAIALAIAALGCAGMAGPAWAQKNLGSYAGTIDVSHSLPTHTYRAHVKVSMPVSERNGNSITAEFLAGEAPNAMVFVSQWDTFHRNPHADSGGQFNTTTCSLAGPAEIPMSATGVLNLDLKKKTHALSLVLLAAKELDFNCIHSRSGASKKKMGVAMVMGTGAPGVHYETQLPFADAGSLRASYTLMPTAETKGQHGPIVQVWELKQVR